MIPGPVEFDPAVLSKLGEATPGHLAAGFMEEFGSALEGVREVFAAGKDGQPFILSGSGTLGWEIVAANLLEQRPADDSEGADVLVANTGYFSDSWKDCFEAFGHRVAQIAAPELGGTVTPAALADALRANPTVKLVALTQVDTSTAVLNDIGALAAAARSVRSDILVSVDGVCSFGAEEFLMEQWGVDAAFTCSQKALGVPPGLCALALSSRALSFLSARKTRVPSYYANLNNWLPIMRAYEARKPSYFATPAVNLIRALKVSLDQLRAQTMAKRVEQHVRTSRAFKAAVTALGLRQVPSSPAHAANTLSAIYFPTGDAVNAAAILPSMVSSGVIAAGGLHKDIKATYFRVGHMGHSVMSQSPERDDVKKVVQAIETALEAAKVPGEHKGKGVAAYEAALKQ